MAIKTIELDGKKYVVLEREEYERLTTLAKAAALPPLPPPGKDGLYPAVDYCRASIARGIIKDRVVAGLTQRALAKRAGIRVETLCRIETGKNTPSVRTLELIDRALKAALGERRPKGR